MAADSPLTPGLTAKGRATRERILRSAAQVLLEEGLSGLNLDRVRSAADVSGSQLSHYFADKPALIRAVLERQIEVVLDFHRDPKLGGLATFDDYERWADLNMRHVRKAGYAGTPAYHAMVGQLAKSDAATRETLADGYWRWIDLLEVSFQRMSDRGLLAASADPRDLACVVVGGHQGGGTMTFAYREEWPLADMLRFVVNYLRLHAVDSAERQARQPRRTRRTRTRATTDVEVDESRFTAKGLTKRTRIVDCAAELMFERGVNGTSLDDVRRSAKVSGSQLAHYFVDKRDLTRHVIASRADDVTSSHPPVDSVRQLHAWSDDCCAKAETNYLRGGCVFGSLAGELLESDDGILDDLAAGYDSWLDIFLNGLDGMCQRGDLTGDADPHHLAVVLLAAQQGGAMLTHAMGTTDPLRAAVGAAVEYVASFQATPA
jgi:AcrR family transcriptional regulator